MKRIASFLLVLALLIPCTAFADIDLSGMSYDELVALKDQIDLAIWNSQEWQEVTVPQGVWKVGEDIPAGHWTIKTAASTAYITICSKLDESGKDADIWNSKVYYTEFIYGTDGLFYDADNDLAEIDYDLTNGLYVIIESGSVIFTPYAGKPSLGFK